MGKDLGRASACEEHQWKGLNGVCASCLRNRLMAIVSSQASCYATQSSISEAHMRADAADVDQTSSTLSEDLLYYSPADASFLWQQSNSAGKGGLQRGRNSKELRLCDPKDDNGLCLVYFDADAVDPELRARYEKSYKIVAAGSCRKAGGAGDALAAQRAHRCPRTNSSLRMDGALKNSEKKSKATWTPSTILRRLFSSSKATITRAKTQPSQEFSGDIAPATAERGSLARGASLREGAAAGSVCKSNSSSEMPGSPDKMHPLRRVMPVTSTSTGCYERITETMRHEYPIHRFSCHTCSKPQPMAANCSKSVRTSKAMIKPGSKLGSNMDLEKHFKGAAASWSKSNPAVDQPEILRRPSNKNQSAVLFYKDQTTTSQSSFRSSPVQPRKSRPRKKTSRHGIFQLSPYSLGNDAWNCHHLSLATHKRTSQLPKHRLT